MAKNPSNDPLVNMKEKVDKFIGYVAEQMGTKGVEGVLKLFDPNDPEYPKDFADKVGGLINSTLFNIPLRGRPPLVYVGPPDEKGNIKYLDPSKAQRLILENIIAGRRWMEGLALVEYNSETMPRRYKVEWTKGDVLRDIKRFAAKELSTRRGVASAIKDTKAKYAELMAEDFAKIPITVSASEYENVEDTWSKHFERWWREQTSPQNIENFRKDNNLNKYITSYGRRVGFYGDVPGSNGLKFIMWSKVRVPTSDRFQYEDLALGDDVKNNAINIVENWAELPWVIPDSVLDQLNQIVTSQIGHFVGVENQKAKAQIKNLHTLLGLIQDKIDNIDANSSNSPGGEIERTQIAAQSTLDMVTRKLAIMNTNMELGDINDELFFSLKKLYEQNSLGLDTETYLEALRELKKNNGFNIDLFIETKLKQKNPDQEVLTYNFGVMLNIGKDKLYTVESALSNQIKAIFAKYQSQISNLI
ncbi:hypothetical protein EBZ38_06375, partial [bacterium]|nr:hypothetical protein [bacterium]